MYPRPSPFILYPFVFILLKSKYPVSKKRDRISGKRIAATGWIRSK